MKRTLLKPLKNWVKEEDRKPLLLRGARQVGKSYLVRELGKSFSSFVEINFELMPELARLFEENLEPHNIIKKISVALNKAIVPRETLLFFDEIQACPNAITALRYFYENMPELHVIAAGSLIEFAIEQVGVPVGRVTNMYLYPLSFLEFLEASEDSQLVDYLHQHAPHEAMDKIFHEKLLALFGEYIVIGGMPEVVNTWLSQKNFSKVQQIQNSLLDSYKQDFSKYSKNYQVKYVDKIFNAVPLLLGKKFVFRSVDQDLKSRELKPALELLEKAGIVTRIFHSSGNGIPLGAEINYSMFKVIFLDVGLAQALLGAGTKEFFINPEQAIVNKGELVEASVGQELLAYANSSLRKELYYWNREQRGANAEVDYLEAIKNKVIPIEVKSGSSGSLKSLHLFLKEKTSSPYGLQISTQNFGDNGKIKNIPIYAISSLFQQ